jgi:hypothetical protein
MTKLYSTFIRASTAFLIAVGISSLTSFSAFGAPNEFQLSPLLSSDKGMADRGYSCFLNENSKSYLILGSGEPSQVQFKPDGKNLLVEVSDDKFRWMQQFGFEVDGITNHEGFVIVGQYTIHLKKRGPVSELFYGNELPVEVTISRAGRSFSLLGSWSCGG